MIKAEIITHEGNVGPNWLDHCKSLVTPWTVTVAIIAVAILFSVAATTQSRDVGRAGRLATSYHSEQAKNNNPLGVEPVIAGVAVQPTTNKSVQAVAGTSSAALPGSTETTNVLGAKATPSLNTAKTPNTTTSTTGGSADPTRIRAQQLTQTIHTTLTETSNQVNQRLNQTLNSLQKELKL